MTNNYTWVNEWIANFRKHEGRNPSTADLQNMLQGKSSYGEVLVMDDWKKDGWDELEDMLNSVGLHTMPGQGTHAHMMPIHLVAWNDLSDRKQFFEHEITLWVWDNNEQREIFVNIQIATRKQAELIQEKLEKLRAKSL